MTNRFLINKPNKQTQNPLDFQTKRDGYFKKIDQGSDDSNEYREYKDQTIKYIPDCVKDVSSNRHQMTQR